MEFVTKGYNGKTIHGSYSHSTLKISGHFHSQGPQAVNDSGGAPKWVDEVFKNCPSVMQIAVNNKDRGVVWSRMTDNKPLNSERAIVGSGAENVWSTQY